MQPYFMFHGMCFWCSWKVSNVRTVLTEVMQKSTDAYVILCVLFLLLIPGLCFVLLLLLVSPLTNLSPPPPSSCPFLLLHEAFSFFKRTPFACLPSYYRTLTLLEGSLTLSLLPFLLSSFLLICLLSSVSFLPASHSLTMHKWLTLHITWASITLHCEGTNSVFYFCPRLLFVFFQLQWTQ